MNPPQRYKYFVANQEILSFSSIISSHFIIYFLHLIFRSNPMLDVFFTVDVEIWCNGWKDLEKKFPAAFQQYIYGKTTNGEYGLRYKLKQLQDHGLLGVFFIEPLFATRFGLAPLQEIVGLVQEYGQEIQLHLHTEWENESVAPLLSTKKSKRQFMRDFSFAEQSTLIAAGQNLLVQAGAQKANAFRAGSFGMNVDTLKAVAANQIQFDSSYNASLMGLESGLMPGKAINDTLECEDVIEYPMTVFNDGTNALRHAQLGACSIAEIKHLMFQSIQAKRKSFVMLSHNFELMNTNRDKPDPVMIKRFRQFCEFIANHSAFFQMRGFRTLAPQISNEATNLLVSPRWLTIQRTMEQIWRRRY